MAKNYLFSYYYMCPCPWFKASWLYIAYFIQLKYEYKYEYTIYYIRVKLFSASRTSPFVQVRTSFFFTVEWVLISYDAISEEILAIYAVVPRTIVSLVCTHL